MCAPQVGPIVPALLPPLVTKLAGSDSSPLIVHLLLVVAQLTLINTNQLIDCLAAQPAPGLSSFSCLFQPSCMVFELTGDLLEAFAHLGCAAVVQSVTPV